MTRLKWARRLAWFATGLVLVGVAFVLAYLPETLSLVKSYDDFFKLIGLGIGPILALLGFFWGVIDKAELKDLAEELGKARQKAEDEKKLAAAANADVGAKVAKIEALEHDLATIADSGKLWKLRPNAPFPEYRGWKYDPLGAKIVTIGLFKGGVGKSHLAANFAAYVSERQQKPVLLIDLDYQGSVSVTMLSAAGLEPVGSNVDTLFDGNADLATLSSKRIHLAGHNSETREVALNGGLGLARTWIVPSDYTLAEVESRLLIDRVFNERSVVIDERYRLAHLLLHPSVRRDYAMIIIDTPPRMTLGTVNALVASHSYLVPTILDRVSSEAVKPFLTQVENLKSDLELDLRLAGIVGSMTRQNGLTGNEPVFFERISDTAMAVLGAGIHMIPRTLPRKVQVNNSEDLGYFLSDANGPLKDQFYDPIFDELWKRIMTPHESS